MNRVFPYGTEIPPLPSCDRSPFGTNVMGGHVIAVDIQSAVDKAVKDSGRPVAPS